MILFDDVVEVFDLTNLDARLSFALWLSSAAVLAPLLSIVIFSGVPFLLIALRKNRSAALRSACGDRKSTVAPAIDARYKYFQAPLTLT